ncbi:hypothetical protein ACOSOMT5_P2899 [Acidiphilium sp. MT5]
MTPNHVPDETDTEAFVATVKRGLASMGAGRTVPYEDVRRWVLSWGTSNELPKPECQ